MIEKIARKMHREERGFTLIELMVVVLIIGILIAIALPTFLGARNRANDKAAQSGLRNTIAAAKTCFTDHDAYRWVVPAPGGVCDHVTLATIEQSLTFVGPGVASTDPSQISVLVQPLPAGATNFYAAALSKSGTCFYIHDDQQGTGTEYAKSGNACTGNQAPAEAYGPSW